MRTVNVLEITEKLVNDSDKIITVLEHLGYENIRDRGKYFQARNPDGDNDTAFSILKDTLQYNNYTRGRTGNIYSLVMEDTSCNFPKALEKIAKWCSFSINDLDIKYPFHSFYKGMVQQEKYPELAQKTYSDCDLPEPNALSYLFFKDGVALNVQSEWGIRVDLNSNRIVIPEYSFDGKLIGAKARANDSNCPLDKRWSMYIPFSKSLSIYGFSEHYKSISQKRICYITESEKSILQEESWGFKYGLAIGGHDISKTQAKYLKSLLCDKYIVAFDEGISEDEIHYHCEKLLIDNQIMKNKIGYIYDKEHDILKVGSKDSPTDLGFSNFKKLATKYVKYIN